MRNITQRHACPINLFFLDNDTAESIDLVDERNRTDLRMKLNKTTVDEEEEEEEEEKSKIDAIYEISDKRIKISLVSRRTTALQSCW